MKQVSMFYKKESEPLASRVRPDTLDGFYGQRHLLGSGQILRQMIGQDSVPSMIFWGPPGVGKTTLARIIAKQTAANYISFSAASSGIKDIKQVMEKAEADRNFGEKTIVFVDEIHRFNKAQQDAFLPYVEQGSIVLIGATTENPSFEVNSALLSRMKVFVLQPLTEDDLTELLGNALKNPNAYPDFTVNIADSLIHQIAVFANGDARTALNTLDIAVLNGDKHDDTVTVKEDTLKQIVGKRSLMYDKAGEEHYNIISALHKSMRNSDADAALYWLARMLEGGEDPLYIARRMIRFACEDIGMADSHALQLTVSAYQACHFIGMPECNVILAHAAVYLALSPKSRKVDDAYSAAAKDAREQIAEPVPLQLRNAPTRLMKELGYGTGYQYVPGSEYNITTMQCMPDSLADKHYYFPTAFGDEAIAKEASEKIAAWKHEMAEKQSRKNKPTDKK